MTLQKFSPCSIRSMGRVLTAKAPFCFEHEMATFCGNGRVEQGEQCDVGLQVRHSIQAETVGPFIGSVMSR